jgi:hypothetical protein
MISSLYPLLDVCEEKYDIRTLYKLLVHMRDSLDFENNRLLKVLDENVKFTDSAYLGLPLNIVYNRDLLSRLILWVYP